MAVSAGMIAALRQLLREEFDRTVRSGRHEPI
jgi:hypothetical protein